MAKNKVQMLFTVAECGEVHSMGVYRDDITNIEEAIKKLIAAFPDKEVVSEL